MEHLEMLTACMKSKSNDERMSHSPPPSSHVGEKTEFPRQMTSPILASSASG